MGASLTAPKNPTGWKPIPDPDGRFSSGIPDFDRLLGGGFKRGSFALFVTDETVGLEDLDLLTFPTYLNSLYQSRGFVAVLPARDSPHDFRARLTHFVTRRRFDTRVRIFDYVGEDRGRSYVANMKDPDADVDLLHPRRDPKARKRAIAKAVATEKAAQGGRGRPFVESFAFEVFDTLMGSESAVKLFFHGIKRTRQMGNLGVGFLGPGLGCAAAVRRMVDTEFSLRRDDMGLIIRGMRPSFRSFVVTADAAAGRPHTAFVPRPMERESGR
ncbi:MAG: gas vesicle protein GvpD basic region 2 domain-containing protein [Thermoplasmata archaeon]